MDRSGSRARLLGTLALSLWLLPHASGLAQAGDDAEETRKWISHKVVPRESWTDIADRYGVSVRALKRWNKKRVKSNGWLMAGKKLRVYARRTPPPREKTFYSVKRGDTWQKIADRFGVPKKDLEHWNKGVPRRFKAGQRLKVYTDPREPAVEQVPGAPAALPDFSVKPGGYSVGRPNRGRLTGGVRLPDSEHYTKRKPDESWGTTHAVLQIQKAIAMFRRDTGWNSPLEIGAISRRSGGRFRPHRSHQSGRDVDIRLPKLAGVPSGKTPSINEIDWTASWVLIRSFVATGEVEYIFLDYRRQRRLFKAAQSSGATDEELDRLLQYPRGARTNNGVVRHSEGHVVHIHVRIKCATQNRHCES